MGTVWASYGGRELYEMSGMLVHTCIVIRSLIMTLPHLEDYNVLYIMKILPIFSTS